MYAKACCWLECYNCKTSWQKLEGMVHMLYKGADSYPICDDCLAEVLSQCESYEEEKGSTC